jgi:hypothetical protein
VPQHGARAAMSLMVAQSRRRRTPARLAVTTGRWIGIDQPQPLKFKSHADVSFVPFETMNELLNKIK